ncbi:hypothetical protein RQN30_06610 [Arcanobacterium hippocoleae]
MKNQPERTRRHTARIAMLAVVGAAAVGAGVPIAVAQLSSSDYVNEDFKEMFEEFPSHHSGVNTPEADETEKDGPAAPANPEGDGEELNSPEVQPREEAAHAAAADGDLQPFPAPSAAGQDQTQSPIKDSKLRACVRLNAKPRLSGNAVPTAENVGSLTALNCTGMGVKDLTGLESAKKLVSLNLTQNEITDLSPLNNLTNLKELRLDRTGLKDFSSLKELPNLEKLYLYDNGISALDTLGDFPKLAELSVLKNEITDLTPVTKYSQLTELNAAQNRVEKLASLAGLTKLHTLKAHHNKLTSLAGIEKLAGLHVLEVGANKLTSISEAANLAELGSVSVRENKITDLSPLAGLSKLYRLDVSENPADPGVLSNLKFVDVPKGYSSLEPRGLIKINTAPKKDPGKPDAAEPGDKPGKPGDKPENPGSEPGKRVDEPGKSGDEPGKSGDSETEQPKQPKQPDSERKPLPPVNTVPAPALIPGALTQYFGAPGAAAGSSVAQQACDFTGDSQPDLVIGAWAHQEQEKGIGMLGAAYVVPNGSKPGDLDAPDNGVLKIYGPKAASLAGFNVNCVGDVNGDGKADIGISAHKADRGYVVFGTDDRAPIHLDKLGGKGIEIAGAPKLGAGWIVTGAGDLNQDGKADIAVASQAGGPDKKGEITVLAGRSASGTVSLADDTGVLLRVQGGKDLPVFNVAGAGDVDGDGFDDLLVGGYYASVPGANAPKSGMAWVVSGKSRGVVNVAGKFDGYAIYGPLRGADRLGISVAAAGDLNKDGYADMMIAADPVKGNGAVAVVLGAPRNETVKINPADIFPVTDSVGSRGWWIIDSRSAGYLGYGMAAVPAADRYTGTIVLGSSESARVTAFDTSILTGSIDNPRKFAAAADGNQLGGVVDLAKIDPAYAVELNGSKDRLGRAVGVVNGFNEFRGNLMVAGADRAGGPTGRGGVVLAKIPAVRKLGDVLGVKMAADSGVPKEKDELEKAFKTEEKVKADSKLNEKQPLKTESENAASGLAATGAGVVGLAAAMFAAIGGGIFLRKRSSHQFV